MDSDFSPAMKLSSGKHTYPGRKQVSRVSSGLEGLKRKLGSRLKERQ